MVAPVATPRTEPKVFYHYKGGEGTRDYKWPKACPNPYEFCAPAAHNHITDMLLEWEESNCSDALIAKNKEWERCGGPIVGDKVVLAVLPMFHSLRSVAWENCLMAPGFVGDLQVFDPVTKAPLFDAIVGWDLGYDIHSGVPDPNWICAKIDDGTDFPYYMKDYNLELCFTFTAVPEAEEGCEPCVVHPCFDIKGSATVTDHCYRNKDCWPEAVCPPCNP